MSALPGPMFNLAIYVGALIDGFIGGVSCWAALFAPAVNIFEILAFILN